MAAGHLPAPGAAAGPCRGKCAHRDCIATRADAEKICRHCREKIGFGVRFFADGPEGNRYDSLVHELCELKAIEKEAK